MLIGYLRPDSTTVHFMDMEDTNENWHSLLGCSTIETHRLNRSGSIVFLCDESGLLKEDQKPCLFWGDSVLIGSIGFAHEPDREGNLQALTIYDVHQIMQYCSTHAAWQTDMSEEGFKALHAQTVTESEKKPVQAKRKKVRL